MGLKKRELEKVWKQLDGALEAIERLETDGDFDVIEDYRIDFSSIVNLKDDVEELIEQKTRKK